MMPSHWEAADDCSALSVMPSHWEAADDCSAHSVMPSHSQAADSPLSYAVLLGGSRRLLSLSDKSTRRSCLRQVQGLAKPLRHCTLSKHRLSTFLQVLFVGHGLLSTLLRCGDSSKVGDAGSDRARLYGRAGPAVCQGDLSAGATCRMPS